jgi:aspartyl-tRNA(Asn)/glutamyl-tRNA(Gln) amidotransferase subunit A
LNSANLEFSPFHKISPMIRNGTISPVKLTEEILEQIDRLNPQINAYISVLRAQALSDAKRAEKEISRSNYLGMLHGIPVAVKDNIEIENVMCTAGSKILENNIAKHDSTVVSKLKAAGAIIVGTTNLHEFASGATSINPFYGAVKNPWDPQRIAGGSSGGSAAAVAAGLAFAALGTDTSGSVRIPAALCGVVGLKPTFGRVSNYGVIPLSSSLDHVGIITRNVLDASLVLQEISGYDQLDRSSIKSDSKDFTSSIEKSISGIRVGVIKEYFHDVLIDEVRDAFSNFTSRLTDLGVSVVDIELPSIKQIQTVWSCIRFSEASAFHSEWMKTRASDYGADVLAKLKFGLSYSAVEYIKSLESMTKLREDFPTNFKSVDLMITPAIPMIAPKIDETKIRIGNEDYDVYSLLTRLGFPFNVLGAPAIVIPVASSKEGLPIASQIIGPPLREDIILRVANQYEQKFGPFPIPNNIPR